MAKAASATRKAKRGRPAVGSTQIGLRLPPVQLKLLDAWIKTSSPKPTRPEAIRQILAEALPADRGTLKQQIERAERKVAGGQKVTGEKSPDQGMAMLRKGAAENKLRTLKEERRAGSK